VRTATGSVMQPGGVEGESREPLRFALIGAGAIAGAHATALLEHPERARTVAVCDPVEGARAALLGRLPGARGFESIAAALAEEEVDAAIICTPHDLHFAQAMEVVQRGLPVLVEKPVTCTTGELRTLAAAAADNGSFVLPGQTQRFMQDVIWARAWMDADPELLGDVTSFAIQSMQDIRAYIRGASHWLLDGSRAGGGVTISLAVHQLDLIRHLTGRDYVRVSASARYDPPFVNGAESSIAAMLELEGGAVGTLQAGYLTARAPFCESLDIIGTNGSLSRQPQIGEYTGPLMMASSHGREPAEWGDQYAGWAPPAPAPELGHVSPNPFANEQGHLIDVIRGDAEPILTLEENFNTIAAIHAVGLSAREERPVRVETW
jgi:predicted dehydrogenase